MTLLGWPRTRLARGARMRSRRQTRAARKLENALDGALSAGRMPQVHPRYICTLTCAYVGSQRSRLRGRRRADGPHAGRSAREPWADRRHADTAPAWAETAQREDAAHRPLWVPSTGRASHRVLLPCDCASIGPRHLRRDPSRLRSGTSGHPGLTLGGRPVSPFPGGGGAGPRPAQLISGPLPSGLSTPWTSRDG
jgi:hypothetical protein